MARRRREPDYYTISLYVAIAVLVVCGMAVILVSTGGESTNTCTVKLPYHDNTDYVVRASHGECKFVSSHHSPVTAPGAGGE